MILYLSKLIGAGAALRAWEFYYVSGIDQKSITSISGGFNSSQLSHKMDLGLTKSFAIINTS